MITSCHNLSQIRTMTNPGVDILAVVKDCAYGCGSVMIARTLEQQGGVRFFAVARPQEAFLLRDEGIMGSILVLGEATQEQLKTGWDQNIIFTCNDITDLENWIAGKSHVRFHCNIDTGMSRMGLRPEELGRFAQYS